MIVSTAQRTVFVVATVISSGCGTTSRDVDRTASNHSDLANGRIDRDDAYSNVVELVYESANKRRFCSGTLLGCRKVVTAAHCVCDPEATDAGTLISSNHSCGSAVTVRFNFYAPFSERILRDGTAEIHPAYREEETATGTIVSSRGDVAVITLTTPAPALAQPAGLRFWPTIDDGTNVTLVGYGARMGYAAAGTGFGAYGHCDKNRYWQDHIRRFGDTETVPFEWDRTLFPDLFRVEKSRSERNKPLPLPGDSGGPALISGEVLGITSLSECSARRPAFSAAGLEGASFYTHLGAYDAAVTQKTIRSWVVEQLAEVCDNGIDDDCNGQTDCADSACTGRTPCCGHEGSSCCGGTSCVDAGLLCNSDTQRCVVPPPVPTEVCNFQDDNGDGQVDEGFDWVSGPWTSLFPTAYYAAYLKAIVLQDGRVALAGGDSFGGGSDRGYLAILNSNGELLNGPIWTSMPAQGLDLVGVAEGPNGQVAAMFDGTNYNACNGCGPVLLARANSSDLSLVGSGAVQLPFALNTAYDLAGTSTGYVLLSRERSSGAAHLTWVNAQSGGVTSDVALAPVNVYNPSLAAGNAGFGWILGHTPTPAPIEFGIALLSGSAGESLGPITLAGSDGSTVFGDGGGRGLIAFGNDFVAGYSIRVAGADVPQAVRVSGSTIVAGPVTTGSAGYQAKDLARIGDNLIAIVQSPSSPQTAMLRRLGSNLQPLNPSTPDTVISPESGYISAVGTSNGILVFRGNSLARQVEVTRITCPN